MFATLILGNNTDTFKIIDYRLNEKTGMITLILPDENLIVHKSNVIISVGKDV